jgi:mannose-6-phosphate isomerase-like protein (cupin superfamily)
MRGQLACDARELPAPSRPRPRSESLVSLTLVSNEVRRPEIPSSSHAATLERFDGSEGPRKLGPQDGKFVDLEAVGVRFLAWTEETGGGCSIVEHPIPPRTPVAPLHKHSREDEYSFVLEGRMGAQLGDDVVYADAGDFVSSRASSGTRSGTRATAPAGSSRSSRPAASSTSSTSSPRRWPNPRSTRRG